MRARGLDRARQEVDAGDAPGAALRERDCELARAAAHVEVALVRSTGRWPAKRRSTLSSFGTAAAKELRRGLCGARVELGLGGEVAAVREAPEQPVVERLTQHRRLRPKGRFRYAGSRCRLPPGRAWSLCRP